MFCESISSGSFLEPQVSIWKSEGAVQECLSHNMKNRFRLRGLYAAAFTPMDQKGNFVPATVPKIVDHLLEIGIAGLYITGSAGEGPLLTDTERKEVTETYIDAAKGKLPVVVQVGHTSLKASRELAEHAARHGANAISATPALYFKPSTVESLIACLKEVASGAPDLPFYYYHIPPVTGVNLDMVSLLEKSRGQFPSLVGIKFSDSALENYTLCAAMEDYDIVYGRDEMLLPALSIGAKGAVGSTYNYLAPIANAIIDAFNQGDLSSARDLHEQYCRLIRIIHLNGGQRVLKPLMKLVGVDCGPNRLPLTTPSAEEFEAMECDLRELGFYKHIKVNEKSSPRNMESGVLTAID